VSLYIPLLHEVSSLTYCRKTLQGNALILNEVWLCFWDFNKVSFIVINTFTAGLIQAVCTKSSSSPVSLCRHNSGTKCVRELFKPSKDLASLWVRNEQIFLVMGFGFFVSDIISGGLLGLFGPLHLALGPNC